MRTLIKLALVLFLATAGLVLAHGASPAEATAGDGKRKKARDKAEERTGKEIDIAPSIKAALVRTNKALKAVGPKVKETGKGTAQFKKAVAHQQAARRALRKDRPHLALHLTRAARLHLVKAAKAAGIQPPAETETTPEEQVIVDETPVDQAEADTLATEAEASLPADDALLADENFGDAETPAATE